MAENFLYNKLDTAFKYGVTPPEIPDFVLDNMPKKFKAREYQKKALQYFIHWYKLCIQQYGCAHQWSLFNMATGSGKTNIMAMLILYLYNEGYRNFIFLVNSTNIVQKTKRNFLDNTFGKHLFNDTIIIKNKRITLNDVENFTNNNDENINIHFSTIQGLHDKLNNPKENGLSFSDFEDKKIVILGDEAHHFNSSTKKLSRKEKKQIADNEKTWEETIKKIYDINNDNILLEFTATLELDNKYIKEKYSGNPANILYDYSLTRFRRDGYTKDLMNLRTSLPPIERTILAMLFSQYRLKLFEKYGITEIKPVVLLKAHKDINNLESFYDEFTYFLKNLFCEKTIQNIQNNVMHPFVWKMFKYFSDNGISFQNLVDELKQAFSTENIIKIHSKLPNIDELQYILNDLDNPKNNIRMVITLDMLHEGWDVLNLFDIVRLCNNRQGGGSSPVAKTTTQEAQLIGRGARNCPFRLNIEQDMYKRKFDNNLDNELRICETLLFHCIDDSRYISEIKQGLAETGFEFSELKDQFECKLKESFKNSDFYKTGHLFVNTKIRKSNLDDGISDVFNQDFVFDFSKTSCVEKLYDDDCNIEYKTNKSIQKEFNKTFNMGKLFDTNPNIVLKAFRTFPCYRFDKLKEYFLELESVSQFIHEKKYMGKFNFTIKTNREITNVDIYNGLLCVFDSLSQKIFKGTEIFSGSHDFKKVKVSDIVTNFTRNIATNKNSGINYGEGVSQNNPYVPDNCRIDLSENDWYVYNDCYGTPQEKHFVYYFSTKVKELKEKYSVVYLIRNERALAVYSFEDGRRLEPDYIVVLGNDDIERVVFVEPKGDGFVEHDKWKEDFLLQLSDFAINGTNCKIIGLPFYTYGTNNSRFNDAFCKATNICI